MIGVCHHQRGRAIQVPRDKHLPGAGEAGVARDLRPQLNGLPRVGQELATGDDLG